MSFEELITFLSILSTVVRSQSEDTSRPKVKYTNENNI